MVIDRRIFVKGLAAFGLYPTAATANAVRQRLFLGSVLKGTQNYAALIRGDGEILHKYPLPGRGHGGAANRNRGRAVIFARRPGNFALAFDTRHAHVSQVFHCPPDRHFYGHGFFSPDGNYLYATENDFEAERGVLGIYDAQNNYRRVAELDCFGMGCHEAVLLSDGITIAVANGGIATHPDFPRQKLNLPSMASSIAYIHRMSGKKLRQVFLPPQLQKFSLRHLAEGRDSAVYFGGQYQGSKLDRVDMVGFCKSNRPIEFISLPQSVESKLKQYIGSVAVSDDQTQLAVSCPRGGRLLIIDTDSHKLRHVGHYPDICGIAANGPSFIASSGEGILSSSCGAELNQLEGAWDNHLTAIC